MNVLYPKFVLDPYIGMFLCTLIRQEKFRYNYGRKWHLDRMNETIIRLPVTAAANEPDWQFMGAYIRSLSSAKAYRKRAVAEKPNASRGRPIKNKVDQIQDSPEHIARAIFRAADKKRVDAAKPKKKKPN